MCKEPQVEIGALDGVGLGIFTQQLPDGGVLQLATPVIGHGMPNLPTVDLTAEDPVAKWTGESKTIVGGFKTIFGMDSETEVLEINMNTTFLVLALEKWLGDRLVSNGFIADFADRPRLLPLAPAGSVLPPGAGWEVFAEVNGDGATLVHGLTRVVQQLNLRLPADAALRAWNTAARAAYAARQTATEPMPSPVEALRSIAFNGAIPADYAGIITGSPLLLRGAFNQFAASPMPVSSISISGTLSVIDHACLLLTTADGLKHELVEQNGDRFWPSATVIEGSRALATGIGTSGKPRCGDRQFQVLNLSIVSTPSAEKVDTDNDGIDDAYEQTFFGTLAFGPNDDPDGDGVTLGQSYREGAPPGGTLPVDPGPNDAPPSDITITSEIATGRIVLEWTAEPGQPFTIGETSSLTDWSDSGVPVVEVSPGRYRWEKSPNPLFSPVQYYRVESNP